MLRRSILTLPALGLSACGQPPAAPGLTVASFPDLDRASRAVLADWNALEPEHPLQLVSRNYADHHNAMNAALATGSGLPQGAGAGDGKALPAGAQQIATDFGAPGWGGPCPPAGDTPHRYNFTVYALKVDKLELPANATASLTGFMVNSNAIAKASLSARYGR